MANRIDLSEFADCRSISSEGSGGSYGSLNSLRSSVTGRSSRFDNHSSDRKSSSYTERVRTSNMGPCVYDRGSSQNSQKRKTPIVLMTRAKFSIVPKAQAPPVGTYHIPRIMSPGRRGSEMGIQITSSFKSSGRSGHLMQDCQRYLTLREDVTLSNIGPGMYDTSYRWSPSKNRRTPAAAADTERPCRSSSPLSTTSAESLKPWQVNNTISLPIRSSAMSACGRRIAGCLPKVSSSCRPGTKQDPCSSSSSSSSTITTSTSSSSISSSGNAMADGEGYVAQQRRLLRQAQRLQEIDQVKQLPSYK